MTIVLPNPPKFAPTKVLRYTVSVNIGKENFYEWLTIRQIRQFFSYQNFLVYSTLTFPAH